MYIQEKERKRSAEHEELKSDLTEIMQTLYKQSEAEDAQLQKEIDTLMDTNKEIVRGLLSVQSNQFRNDCHALLREDHIITIDEFEQLVHDHEAYNGLGGNHTGDQLFDLVKIKYESQITK